MIKTGLGSRLPTGGMNLFQQIKAWRVDAEKSGSKICNLSVGQPTGPAIYGACQAAAAAAISEKQEMHEYQDNGTPGNPGFAQRFSQFHCKVNLAAQSGLAYLPIPGIKPMLQTVILACGSQVKVVGMTAPGYSVPATQAAYMLRPYEPAITNPNNGFLVDPDSIPAGTTLLMLNYPHNPSGVCATEEYWRHLCRVCSDRGIRVFNDAAYTILTDDGAHVSLADVAVEFPDLSWTEAYSASKATNFTGWRVGAMVGSADFIGDIATIKGNTDSGLFAPATVGVETAFRNHMDEILDARDLYARRRALLIETLQGCRMKLAAQPRAGFFTLWELPTSVFGEFVQDAEHFNQLMIARGIIGVHFHPYIRYAVVGDVEAMLPQIEHVFRCALGD
jgi:LL-diaminopimelate aminotransferase